MNMLSRIIAVLLGLLAATVTGYILIEDAIHTGRWSIYHIMMPAIMIITIGAGKFMYSAAARRIWTSAAGFALLFAMGTGVLIHNSAGRQAAQYEERVASVEQDNAHFEDIQGAIQRALEERDKVKAIYDTALKGVADRCRRGPTARSCAGARETLAVYEGAVAGWEAKLNAARERGKSATARRTPDPTSAYWAEVAELLMGAKKDAVEKIIKLIAHPLNTLILELASVWFIGYGLYSNPPKSSRPNAHADGRIRPLKVNARPIESGLTPTEGKIIEKLRSRPMTYGRKIATARELGIHPSTVTRAIERYKRRGGTM